MIFTGKGGKSGSWEIRAVQLGNAMGAQVIPWVSVGQCRQADLVVAVKRIPEPVLENIKSSRVKWFWDVLDIWRQPYSNGMPKEWHVAEVRLEAEKLKPTAVVYPNEQMMADVGYPGFVLHHHARPGQSRNPIRKAVEVVGYEGRSHYLDEWLPVLQRSCERRGWRFVVNPAQLADLDIVVALRGGQYDGWACRNWKSGVKLVNARATGTPFVGFPECGYKECASGGERWVTTPEELETALDSLTPYRARKEASDRMFTTDYDLPRMAQWYSEALSRF